MGEVLGVELEFDYLSCIPEKYADKIATLCPAKLKQFKKYLGRFNSLVVKCKKWQELCMPCKLELSSKLRIGTIQCCTKHGTIYNFSLTHNEDEELVERIKRGEVFKYDYIEHCKFCAVPMALVYFCYMCFQESNTESLT